MKAFKLGLKLYHVQVFLILLSALVLCSFLGGNCDSEGMEGGVGVWEVRIPTTFFRTPVFHPNHLGHPRAGNR